MFEALRDPAVFATASQHPVMRTTAWGNGANLATKKTHEIPYLPTRETGPGAVIVPVERDGMTIVFREVPALVCENCGEAFHKEVVTSALLKQAEQAAGVEIDVQRFAVAA